MVSKVHLDAEVSMVAIRLPKDIDDRLRALAIATGKTRTFYAREAILEHIDDLEDYYLAEHRLSEIHAGRVQTIPLAEILKDHDLAD
jgi:RHH-type rel operon transcriptional repressor/antitoxin RelB